ncbi:hypothetical protein BHE74_00034077 [Ensete ventricosum]|nr:hypothetical protein BHE74_00034077 [Ensete ventricosum]
MERGLSPKVRIECAMLVSSPEVLNYLSSCNINPPSSTKNDVVLYVVAKVSARLGPIRVRKTANITPSRHRLDCSILLFTSYMTECEVTTIICPREGFA